MKKNERFMELWNKKVACRMPSKKKIDAAKKQRQIARRQAKTLVGVEMEKVDLILQQEKEIRAYKYE